MQKSVLVTGASGLIGQELVTALVNRNYSVKVLSRHKQQAESPSVQFYEWDVSKGEVDMACVDGVEAVIHLAGENIGALPWSNSRKRTILESRTKSIALIYDLLKKNPNHNVKTVVSASASGYYNDRGDELMTEDKAPKNDFLGQTCLKWEQAVSQGKDLRLRTVSLRSGMVLSANGGVYRKLANMVRKGLGAVPGTGKQWMPWIHIDDTVAMYIFALEHNGIAGAYNMAAPEQITFSTFVGTMAKHLGKPIWLPHIPKFLLKTVMGQMSEMLLSSTRVSSEKIRNAGFQFRYPTIAEALEAVILP
ncbi:TIGR01777 family oxidoreductase [Parapedobacter tibetensis]|uniref:TIGR01777 family oxidoreductase n=1 Tax=Parapedobacter tibetensis TaxID=2972951 RepID=UPI00214D1B9C|nr:TIGR01777 family oxidoreductase [Parapedobacter tibetensis]